MKQFELNKSNFLLYKTFLKWSFIGALTTILTIPFLYFCIKMFVEKDYLVYDNLPSFIIVCIVSFFIILFLILCQYILIKNYSINRNKITLISKWVFYLMPIFTIISFLIIIIIVFKNIFTLKEKPEIANKKK